MRAALALLALAQPARGQEPLRKTDLVRLLSGATLASDELAVLIRRNCLSFTPTGRDRADLAALGADSGVLREIDGCTHRAPLSAPRTGFVLGMGQRAVVGTRPTRALVFEVGTRRGSRCRTRRSRSRRPTLASARRAPSPIRAGACR